MASDNDKSLGNHNSDGSLKNIIKLNSSGNIGDIAEKLSLGTHHSVGKGGRHLSIPFESGTNGDIIMTYGTDQRAGRVECSVQERLPTPPRLARAPRQSAAARPERRRYYDRNIVVACLCLVLISVVFVVDTEHVRATWLCVVDMSLSAPAQAVRGTRTNSLDQLDFQERRQLIASSLSLTDFLHVGAKEVAAVAGLTIFIHNMPDSTCFNVSRF